MNHNKAFLMPVLVFPLIIHACSSNTIVVNTPTDPGSYGVVQPTLTNVILPTSTMPLGTSQSNPAPVGFDVHTDNMIFTISGSVRPADGIVSSGDIFNTQPGQWQQYVFVTLEVTCETPTNQQCHLSPFNMMLLGSDGIVKYPERLISGVDGILEDIDFYGGATISGYVPFIISLGDSHLVLVYESLSGDSIYLALP